MWRPEGVESGFGRSAADKLVSCRVYNVGIDMKSLLAARRLERLEGE